MNLNHVGEGKVVLIAGGGKIYTDIAARFVVSERSLEEIIASPYDAEIVKNILNSNHKAAVEFDYFLFGVEGYARVTEIQLVRKRIASYLIKSGRPNKKGKRSFDMVLPESVEDFICEVPIQAEQLSGAVVSGTPMIRFNAMDLLSWTEQWYNTGVELGHAEQDLRYMKQQATEFKAIIGMNAHALHDWFMVRCCQCAQEEIRDMAVKMLKLSREAAPDLFTTAGPSCKVLGYCPENARQHKNCKGQILTKDQALLLLDRHKGEMLR